ncbi:MAG: nickel pincer cofactor biosynthesis protein LarB [Lachnospiraceae bacterium]|nr:nickel pincer cofactor biosynthesis protein LarB [Lachnospiraceae bacterium]
MKKDDLIRLLEDVKNDKISIDDAVLAMKEQPFTDLGYAKIDHHRELVQGAAEVIYGAGKTPEQIWGIIKAMLSHGQKTILITRMKKEAADYVKAALEAEESGDTGKSNGSCEFQKTGDPETQVPEFKYDELSRIGLIGNIPEPDGIGSVVIACAGTSDLPVAEEAAMTAEIYGNRVIRLYDVGVAGLHRTLSHMDEIMNATVIISIAGMEGALTSVIGGLADCPVIGVPTSVGYGASFGGLSALLAMLNSCASGVSVVNIDNGFGAGYLASMINHR